MELNLIKKEIISLIKNKKELSSIDDEFIEEKLNILLPKYKVDFSKYASFKQFQRSSNCKEIVSKLRSELREIYGVFIKTSLNDFEKKINSIKSYDDKCVDEILLAHQSSNERNSQYNLIYSKLFEELFSLGLLKKFTLIELGCGFNPFAYKFFPIKPQKYYVSDISTQDVNLISKFFKNTDICGTASQLDLLNSNSLEYLSTLEKIDLCFLLKTLDSLETKSRHISKKLISSLNCEYFVVSFPTKTLGGKKTITQSKRNWFENFCTKEFGDFKTIEIPNEIFYIFKKK